MLFFRLENPSGFFSSARQQNTQKHQKKTKQHLYIKKTTHQTKPKKNEKQKSTIQKTTPNHQNPPRGLVAQSEHRHLRGAHHRRAARERLRRGPHGAGGRW